MAGAAAAAFVESKVTQRPVILFSKSYCPDSKKVKSMLRDEYILDNKNFEAVDIERRQDVNEIEDYFMICCLSERRELPQLWIGGKYIGNEFRINHLHSEGELSTLLTAAGLSVPSLNSKPTVAPNTKTTTQKLTPEEKEAVLREEIEILQQMDSI